MLSKFQILGRSKLRPKFCSLCLSSPPGIFNNVRGVEKHCSTASRKSRNENLPSSDNEESDEKKPSNGEKFGTATHLSVMTNGKSESPPALKTVSVVPGKGPPPEPPVTCCMSGCANCVWIAYAEELKAYYGDGGEMARKALDHIEDHSLKAFLKLELGIK